jgi:hypothetical protein
MKGYKGFNDQLQCSPNGKPFQYEVGQTYTHQGTISLCKQGLHFVEHPLDTWTYYKPLDGSRFALVEAEGVSDETRDDTKRVAQSLTIKAEVKIPTLLKAAVEFVFSKVKSSPTVSATTGDSAHSATTGYSAHSATTGDSAHSATTGYSAHSATTGYSAHSATTGNSAHSATTGDSAHSATTGHYAHSATTGDSAHSATTGDYAHSATTGFSAHSATTGDYAHSATTGDYAHSATTGDYAHSATTGDYAHSATTGHYAHSATTGHYAHSATTGHYAHSAVVGKECIAASLGVAGQAKGIKGNWLVLAEWVDDKIKSMGIAIVDGKKIKADTFYTLKDGRFVEATHD